MGKLILFFSADDLKHSRLTRFEVLSKVDHAAIRDARLLIDLINSGVSPVACKGRLVQHGRHVGRVKSVDLKADKLVLVSQLDGDDHEFQISVLLQKALPASRKDSVTPVSGNIQQVDIGKKAASEPIQLLDLLKQGHKQSTLVGRLVSYGKHVGKIRTVNERADTLVLASHTTGEDIPYQLSKLHAKINK